MKEIFLIGYSGHAFVVLESAMGLGIRIAGYHERSEKELNPYRLAFLGSEDRLLTSDPENGRDYFVSIGDNATRAEIFRKLHRQNFLNIIDCHANVSDTAVLGRGVYVGKNACVNALCHIGDGVILNTASVIEHECSVGKFAHIAPGAVLCGNVSVGDCSFVGAAAVVKPGISIGENVVVGAGSVVVRDLESNSIYAGNPARKIR